MCIYKWIDEHVESRVVQNSAMNGYRSEFIA
jgi:hypothetical protein